ncbi:HNH endonuclease signature motif containing protein [Mesorhizobium sp. VK25A]|uniref:HNH endonuclease signature motif containing protein n=1 Tax=Mesorhizobium vachelliae TaxID=3072309 RepID=A0ABU5AEM2_9HYPH|nr:MULTISPECIES: HNH endonuclease signature motif containing protein [unclassified Mesorhizobium]MDX8535728.1 HNH endonuclease signature motif containing protein [Mesorhizobium sp. VK25D]MDX8548454.1 HNH endonuclease signature motif containing protein [Mesorhizobium sp. VK25A]
MTIPSRYKRRVLARLIRSQEGRCCYCKRPFTIGGPTRATIEHKKAKMDGGRDNVGNLAAACFHCNQHRGRQMVQSRMVAKRAGPNYATSAPKSSRGKSAPQ